MEQLHVTRCLRSFFPGDNNKDKDALSQYGMCRRDEAEAQAAGDNSPSKLQRQPSGGGGGCSGSLLSWDFSVGESRGNLACCNTQKYHGWKPGDISHTSFHNTECELAGQWPGHQKTQFSGDG
jgi:hypothetical protein